MKLLVKHDKHKPSWLGCWVCPSCDSLILLEEKDRVQVLSAKRVKFTCPHCGQCERYESDDQRDAGQMFSAMNCEAATERCCSVSLTSDLEVWERCTTVSVAEAKRRADRIP